MSSATNIQTIETLLADPWWTLRRLRACCWRTEGRYRETVAKQLGVGVSTLKDWEKRPSFRALRQALLQEELQRQQAARTRQEQLQDTALSLLEARLKDATQRPEAYSPQDVTELLQASEQLSRLLPTRTTPAEPRDIEGGQPPVPDEVPGPEPDSQPLMPAAEPLETAATPEAEVMPPAVMQEKAPTEEDITEQGDQRRVVRRPENHREVVRLPKDIRRVARPELISSYRGPVRPALAGRGSFQPPPQTELQKREEPAADP